MRKLSLLIVALALCICSVTPALATNTPTLVPKDTLTTSNVSTRAEQTEWRYQYIDGRLSKRLWSLTYNRWLTDWEPIVS